MIDVTVDLPNLDDLVKRIQEAEGDAALHENPAIEPRTGEKKWLRNAAMEGRKLLRVAASRLSKTFPK